MEPLLTQTPEYLPEELKALEEYAISSEAINSALRLGDSSHPDVPRLDVAIARRHFTRPCTLLVGGAAAGFWRYVSQDTFDYPAYLSTTDTAWAERRYYSLNDPIRLTIHVPEGTPVAYLDDIPRAGQAEREYVLGRGSRLQVIERRKVTHAAEVQAITGFPRHPRDTVLLDVELVLLRR